MNRQETSLMFIILATFSTHTMSEAMTGKIVVGNQTYSSGSASTVRGSGKIVTVNRTIGGFNKLSIQLAATIEFTGTGSKQLNITADDNLVDIITTTISNKTLLIESSHSFSTHHKIQIRITGPAALEKLVADGSTMINLHNIDGDSLEITLDGINHLTAEGKVKNLAIKAKGSGEIDTKKLPAENVDINLDGTINAVITVKNKLSAALEGISNVTYYGDPDLVNKTIDGISSISSGN